MVGLGLGLGLPFVRTGGGGGEPVPGSQLTPLSVTPTSRWHPAFSTVAKDGSRVSAASDLMGLAALAEVAASSGPTEMTDGLGRKYWRFMTNAASSSGAWLRFADALALNSRAMAVFFVGRWFQGSGQLISLGQAGGTNTLNAGLRTVATTHGVPYLAGGSQIASQDATNGKYGIAGCQMQVMWMASRAANATVATPDKNLLLGINSTRAQINAPDNVVGEVGGEIGRYARNQNNWARADIYEIVVYQGELTDAQADTIAAELVAGWGLEALTDQAVFDGDSITAALFGSTPPLTPDYATSAYATNPGAEGALPLNWRVVNTGASGNTWANIRTRRDNAASIFTKPLSGRNVVAVQGGANDLPTLTADQIYAAGVQYMIDAGAGVLERGWEARLALNIANANASNFAKITTLRGSGTSGYRNAQFLTDCSAGSGQSYDGKLGLIQTDLITVGGDTVFDTQADAADATYYCSDGLHPNPTGMGVLGLGGDTPQHGYAQRIQDAV